MIANRYTSVLYCNDHETVLGIGDDLKKIKMRLLALLDVENTYSFGVIRDNSTGKVIHRYNKTSID